jgi:glyoxylase-like metal-dependent hydrolase (beta-lactamase superfamily II)
MPDGRPTFPNARYLAPRADWELFTRPDLRPHLPWVDRSIAPLAELGVLDLVEGETPLAEGVTALPTPGHTPGHTSVLVSSAGEGLLILGDVAPHPAQLTRPSWKFGADMDGDTAVTTRAQVLERVEAEGLLVACGHHPRPGFGRLVQEDGARYWRPL